MYSETSPKEILVIDDKMIITIIIKKILKEIEKYKVITLTDSKNAYQKIDEIMPDMVITDINMPDVSGIDITKRLKNKEKYRNIKLIVVSSDYREEVITQLENYGIDAFLKKPFQKEQLIDMIDEVFSKDLIIEKLFEKEVFVCSDEQDFLDRMDTNFYSNEKYKTSQNLSPLYKKNDEDIGLLILNLQSRELKLHNVLSSFERKELFLDTPIIAVPNQYTNFTALSKLAFHKLKITHSSITANQMVKKIPGFMRELWIK